jgi:zinc protease
MPDRPKVPPRIVVAALGTLIPLGASLATPGVPETRTLPNGLRLVVLEDHAVPLVSVNLWVHAGSKDEIDTSAGYAHFLEHLVQRGAGGSGPFEYRRLAYRWGGSLEVRSNYDRTYITATASSSALPDLLAAVAAVAFRADLKDTEIEQELGSLHQEIRNYYDEPSSVAFLETMRAAFPGHPYRYPPLGNIRTLGTLKREPLAAFYRNLYVPNNMALVLAGDLDPARAFALAEAAFGKATRSATLPSKPPAPSAFPGHTDIEKRLDLKDAWTTLSFTGPGYRHPDRLAMEVIARALGDLGGSPIASALARAQAGTASQVTYYRLEDAGMLYVGITPAGPELSYAAAAAALQEIVAFKKRWPTEAETRARVDRILREERLRAERLTERAEALGEAALFGGVRYAWDLPLAFGRLTAADITRVASTYLVGDNLRLVVILPKATSPLSEEFKDRFHAAFDLLGGARGGAPAPDPGRMLHAPEEAWRSSAAAWGDPRDAGGAREARKITLENGLTVLAQEDHRHSLAGASLHLRVGSGDDPPGKEGLAYVAGHSLGAALARRPREAGATAGMAPILPEVSVSRDLTEARFLAAPADLPDGLRALAAAVGQPALPDSVFTALRKAALDLLERSARDPSFVGLELFKEKVYAGHPYAHPGPGTSAGLQAVALEDVAAFRARQVRPDRAVLAICGAFETDEIMKIVRDQFAGWRRPADAPGEEAPGRPADGRQDAEGAPAGPRATAQARAGEFTRSVDAPHSQVIVGVPGPPIDSADFEDVRLLGTALTLTAFEEMVFKRRAAFSATALPEALREGGSLAIGVVAQHPRRDEALFDLQRLMRRLALEGLSQEAARDIIRVQAGRDAAASQGVLATASNLAYREASGLRAAPERAGDPPPGAAAERLKASAARYLRPEAWIVVKVGPPSR